MVPLRFFMKNPFTTFHTFFRLHSAKTILCIVFTLALYLPSSAVIVTAVPHNTCGAGCNGSINASASAGTPPYQYSWDGGATWVSSGLNSGLCPGTSTVIARDALGATDTTSATVFNPGPVTFTATSTNCSSWSACDGQILFSVTGGTPPYTYIVTNPSNVTTNYTTNPVINLCVGTYTVHVTDQNGCVGFAGSYTIVISAPGPPPSLLISASGGMPVCPYTCNRITASASGGIPPYQYSFNGVGGPWQNNGLSSCYTGTGSPVTYSVCVKDANNTITCTSVFTNWPPPMNFIIPNVTASQCGACSGTIQLIGGGPGVNNYTINGWATSQTSNTFTNLCPGIYNCAIINGTCMVGPVSVTVGQTSSLTCTTTQTNATCNGGCNGTITVVTPGTGTFQYSIDAGATWQSSSVFSGLCSGTYSILTQSISSPLCIATNSVTITQPAAIVPATSSISSPACYGGCNGSFTAIATPAGTYQYSINGGVTWQASATFTGLCAGNYTVMAKNGSNCTGSYSFVITQPTQIFAVSTETNISCFGNCNGSISTTATPAGAYQYSINNGVTWFASNTFSGLCAGTYSIKVKNGSNCIATAPPVTITQPSALLSTLNSQNNVTCAGGSDGSAVITASGGTGIISYAWSPGNPVGDGTNSVSGLTAGTWICTITDTNNCTTNQTIAITEPAPIQITGAVSDPVCYGDCNGSFIASVTPADVYQYSIDSGGTWQASNTFSGLCAGTYSVIAKNGSGCIGNYSFAITQPSQVIPTSVATDISCHGNCNGTIATNVIPAGSYQYSIDGGSTWQPSNTFPGLCTGFYAIMVKNGNGCIAIDSANAIIEPAALSIAIISQSDLTCNNNSNGAASVNAMGGTGIISYDWSPGNPVGDGTNSVSGLAAGLWTCTIMDVNNCTTSQTIAITEPAPLSASAIINGTSCALCNGAAVVSASGGTSPYAYDWMNAGDPQNLCAGNYTVIVTDTNNCTDTIVFLIPSSTTISIDSVSSTGTPSSQSNGDATVFVSGISPFIFSWDAAAGNQITQTAINLLPGNYCVNVTDANGCADSVCMNVPVITGMSNVNSRNDLSVFPNPFSQELFISGTGMCHIYIYNASGQLTDDLGIVKLDHASLKLNINKMLPAGIYFIRAENAFGTSVIRVVKE